MSNPCGDNLFTVHIFNFFVDRVLCVSNFLQSLKVGQL
jgi:hypothetical protein